MNCFSHERHTTMKCILPLLTALLLATTRRSSAADGPVPPPKDALPFKLLFSGAEDVFDSWGQLRFGVTPVRGLGACAAPGFTVAAGFPHPDGSWEVFGQQMTEVTPGDEPWTRILAWKLLRATTRDGMTFENQETVFEQTAAWTDHIAIARNGDTGEYLALKLKVDNSGFAYTAFFSEDGRRWQAHPGNPLFYDGDAMSLFWSPVLHRFVCINKSLQPHRKHLLDHGGPTPALGDDSLRDRRVLMMRSSSDGRRWEPSLSMNDVWNRNGRKSPIPSEFLTMPDENDPPDLEFYSGNAFWYHDRAYMMVLNYAASPLVPREHGPQLDNEWWTSRDGLRWERPARGVNALEVFPVMPRLETHPLIVDGRILFPRGGTLLGMPDGPHQWRRGAGQCGVLDPAVHHAGGGLVAERRAALAGTSFCEGFRLSHGRRPGRTGCRHPRFRGGQMPPSKRRPPRHPAELGQPLCAQLAGKAVRLRFRFRGASIYAVTSRENP